MTDIKQTKAQVEDELLRLPGVCGVCTGEQMTGGVMTGKESIVVLVERKVPQEDLPDAQQIPGRYTMDPYGEWHYTDVRQAPVPPCSEMVRPVRSGHQIGLERTARIFTAGPVYRVGGHDYMLTCWHCIASSQDGIWMRCVTQPAASGRYSQDGRPLYGIGFPAVAVGPLDAQSQETGVDAAAILLDPSSDPTRPARGWNAPGSKWDWIVDHVPWVGPLGWPHHHAAYDADLQDGDDVARFPAGMADAVVGSNVRIFGPTVTEAKVFATDLTITGTAYGQPYIMRNQIALLGPSGSVITVQSYSGAAVLDERRRLIGTLTHGQDNFASTMPIRPALRALHGKDVC